MISDTSPISVSDLNKQARRLLESHFDYIWVEGEIGNIARPSSGHWYLTLKDEQAQVRGAMFRNRNQLCKFQPENGQRVKLRARVSLYEGRGEFQLIVEHMELAGDGALQAAFEALKRKLNQEGLFNTEQKRGLPRYPARIGIVTSPTGAAIHDMLNIFQRRFPTTEILLVPSTVQGQEAAGELCTALDTLYRACEQADTRCDAIIIGRGGGSLEDLWCFNDESLARKLAESPVPTVSAVGHETDVTICDFVADYRAPTPSAAAEVLSPDRLELEAIFSHRARQLHRITRSELDRYTQQLDFLERRLRHPARALAAWLDDLAELRRRLTNALGQNVKEHRHRLVQASTILNKHHPGSRLRSHANTLAQLDKRLQQIASNRITHARLSLAKAAGMLDSVSPLATLNRGYAIVTRDDRQLVTRAGELEPGSRFRARLKEGALDAIVETVVTNPDDDPGG